MVHIKHQVTTGSFHLAFGTIQGQCHGGVGARRNAQCRVARTIGIAWITQTIVDHCGGCTIGLVHCHAHIRGRYRDVTAQAHKGHRGRIGLQSGPLACCTRAVGR